MTRVRQSKWLLIFVSLIAAGTLSFSYYKNYPMDHFSCESNFETKLDNNAISGILSFIFNGGTGQVKASFNLIEDGKNVVKMNRIFDFTYTRSDNSYTLISNDSYNTKYIGFMRALLPDFYLLEHSGLQLEIYRQNASGYVVVRADTTILYCDKDTPVSLQDTGIWAAFTHLGSELE